MILRAHRLDLTVDLAAGRGVDVNVDMGMTLWNYGKYFAELPDASLLSDMSSTDRHNLRDC